MNIPFPAPTRQQPTPACTLISMALKSAQRGTPSITPQAAPPNLVFPAYWGPHYA